ncbi:hypothetical protein [Frondihabitans cladoniiphilus]|uniref:Uncharacterized protein n=1 Tax=Frondihabitans cladoniiphilus TaxID=715785 RepID=A0ABP8W5M2_9MICO
MPFRSFCRFMALIAAGAAGGLFLAVDVLLACMLEVLLRADGSSDVTVVGVMDLGWNPAQGAFLDLHAGAFVIAAVFSLAGAAAGVALVRAPSPTSRSRRRGGGGESVGPPVACPIVPTCGQRGRGRSA